MLELDEYSACSVVIDPLALSEKEALLLTLWLLIIDILRQRDINVISENSHILFLWDWFRRRRRGRRGRNLLPVQQHCEMGDFVLKALDLDKVILDIELESIDRKFKVCDFLSEGEYLLL